MGDKGGKKDKAKNLKQSADKRLQEEKVRQGKLPKRKQG